MSESNSTFNVEEFQNLQTDGAFDTEFTPYPEGEYNAVIISDGGQNVIGVREFIPDNGEAVYYLDVPVRFNEPGNEEVHDKYIRYSCRLDLTPNKQGLAVGENKNIKLGQLREAVGQNVPGQPWGFSMLDGQPLRIAVKHDGKGFARIADVGPM